MSNSKRKALFVCNGATGHAHEERAELDYYASDPKVAQLLMEIEPQITDIWEPCVGGGALAEEFHKAGKLKAVSDIVDRGYYPEGIQVKYPVDFMKVNKVWKGDMVTNPPYMDSIEWFTHSLDLLNEGRYLALFLKITFLEGKRRKELFKQYPPIRVWVSSSRVNCYKNGDMEKYGKMSSAACYCWFIWQKGYKGDTVVKWFN